MPPVCPPVLRRTGLLLPALLLLALLGSPFSGLAEERLGFNQRRWTQRDGLIGDEIHALIQDQHGTLWIGSNEGLVRFDGRSFRRFPLKVPGLAEAAEINALCIGPNGELLIAPAQGPLIQLHGGRLDPWPMPASCAGKAIQNLLSARDGALWLAFTDGTVVRQGYDGTQLFTDTVLKGEKLFTDLAQDGDGRVWVARAGQLFRYVNGHLESMPLPRIEEELRITSSLKEGPWIVGKTRIFKVLSGEARDLFSISPSVGGNTIRALLEDKTGHLWIGTRSRGLRRVGDYDIEAPSRMPEDILCLYCDTDGNMWSGSNGEGLSRLSRALLRPYDRQQGLMESSAPATCEDNDGDIWIANQDSGLAFLFKSRLRYPPSSREWMPFVVTSVTPHDQGGVWVSSSRGLLHCLRSNTVHWDFVLTEPCFRQVRVSFTSRAGDLWLALADGRLARVRGTTPRFYGKEQGLDESPILSITQDASGQLWVGSSSSLLYRLEGEERFIQQPLAPIQVQGGLNVLYPNGNDGLWIGTRNDGLILLNKEGVHLVDVDGGLPDNDISQLQDDGLGSLWIGSPAGLWRLRKDELLSFFKGERQRVSPVVIGRDEGLDELSCLEGNQPSSWKTRSGQLWFTSRQGPLCIDPSVDYLPSGSLKLRVTRITGEGQELAREFPVRMSPAPRHLEFEFSVQNLSKPGRIQLHYRLQGYETEWNDAGERSSASYPRLVPGHYRFVLQASMPGVDSSLVEESIDVEVMPLWWQRVETKLLAVLAGAALIALSVRAWLQRRFRARLERLERATALEKERTRIAQNLHDELGAGLTRISLLTQSMDAPEHRPRIDRIYSIANDLARALDEIVWAVNPGHDDLEALAYYLANFAQNFLGEAGIRCRITMPESLPELHLSSKCRHQLFLCAKESLNNIVRHSQATQVDIELKAGDNLISLLIVDNGRGLPTVSEQGPASPTPATGGNGLNNLRSRMQEIGGECLIESEPGKGVRLHFRLPLQPHAPQP